MTKCWPMRSTQAEGAEGRQPGRQLERINGGKPVHSVVQIAQKYTSLDGNQLAIAPAVAQVDDKIIVENAHTSSGVCLGPDAAMSAYDTDWQVS